MIIQKHAKVEKHRKCIQITRKSWYLVIKSVILRNSLFTSNQCSPRAGTFLTNLRLFVKEKLFEICRAQSDCTKSRKFKNTSNIAQNASKCIELYYNSRDFDKFTSHLQSIYFLELELV